MHYIAVGGFEILKVLVGKVGENKNGFNQVKKIVKLHNSQNVNIFYINVYKSFFGSSWFKSIGQRI